MIFFMLQSKKFNFMFTLNHRESNMCEQKTLQSAFTNGCDSQDTNILKKTNLQSTLNTVSYIESPSQNTHGVHIHASGHRSHFMLLLPLLPNY